MTDVFKHLYFLSTTGNMSLESQAVVSLKLKATLFNFWDRMDILILIIKHLSGHPIKSK